MIEKDKIKAMNDLFGEVNDLYQKWDEGNLPSKEIIQYFRAVCETFLKQTE